MNLPFFNDVILQIQVWYIQLVAKTIWHPCMKTILLRKFFLLKKLSIEWFHRRLGRQIAFPKLSRQDECVPFKNLLSKMLCSKLYRTDLDGSIFLCTLILIVYSVEIASLFSRCFCFANRKSHTLSSLTRHIY